MSQSMPCRICNGPSGVFFENDRQFFRCVHCWLIFSHDIVSKDEEHAHYKSQWGGADPASWDSKANTLLNVIRQYREVNSLLDFGSGCGRLSEAFQRQGIATTSLEPMVHGYLKDQNYPQLFDAIVGVEVIEHLLDPWSEIKEMEKVLSPGGVIVFSTLMTNAFIELPDATEVFQNWWYKDDPTHVSFFCNRSLDKLSEIGSFEIDVYADQLFVIRKS